MSERVDFLYQERITEIVDIILYCILGYGGLLFASECVSQLVWIGQSTNAGSHNIDEFFKIIVLAYVVAVFDVFDVGFIEQCFLKAHFLLLGVIRQYLRKATI